MKPDSKARVATESRPRRAAVLWPLILIAFAWVGFELLHAPPAVEPTWCDVDRPPDSSTLVMLSASWCGYCRRARAWLHEADIKHCEYDVETSAEGRRQFAAQPVRVVPLILIGGDTLVGFNRTEIEQTLIAHGLKDFPD